MSTKAYYPLSEIGAGKPGFSKTRSIVEAAFYGNNVVKVNTLKEAYELAFNQSSEEDVYLHTMTSVDLENVFDLKGEEKLIDSS